MDFFYILNHQNSHLTDTIYCISPQPIGDAKQHSPVTASDYK